MSARDILRRIRSAAALPGSRLQITYDGGETIEIDFAPVIRRGGVFTALADPAFFAQVAVHPRGRAVRWSGDMEFCAHALWLQAHAAEVA
jgi:hypothetical protein